MISLSLFWLCVYAYTCIFVYISICICIITYYVHVNDYNIYIVI